MKKTIKRTLETGHLRSNQEGDLKLNEENRTVELVWSTGYKGLRRGWSESYYEELSMEDESVDMSRLQSGAPLLDAHRQWGTDSVIGVVERAWIENKIGKAIVRFAKDPASDAIYQKVKDKVLRNVSVGYQVLKYEDVSERTDKITTYRATKWQPHEISIVAIGFDPNAQVRRKEDLHEVEIEINETRTEGDPSPNVDPQADLQEKERQMTDAEKKALEASAKAEAKQAEKQRQIEIRKAVKSAKLDDSLAEELITADKTADEARAAVLERLATQEPKPIQGVTQIEVGVEDTEKKRQGFEDSLLHRVDSKNFKVTEAGREFYGKSLLRQLENFIPRKSMESDVQYAKRAMSSSDLPLALANVAEKSLQKKYELQPRTYSKWTRKDSLRNYKEHSQVKSGDFASLQERKEGAEFKKGSFGEKNEVTQIKDYGIIHAFTSQMLVNDDLGVLSRMATSGGIASARLENKLAYAALTGNKVMKDGSNLFHANHGNLGSAGAISKTTVGELYSKMRKQKTTDLVDPLNLNPMFFICGPDQEVAAREFFASIIPNQTSNVNIFQGSMEVIVDAEITGNQYYIAADPNMIDTVICYHLEGMELPSIESRIDFRTNSLELKLAHAFVADPMDWRGLGKNAGQA